MLHPQESYPFENKAVDEPGSRKQEGRDTPRVWWAIVVSSRLWFHTTLEPQLSV